MTLLLSAFLLLDIPNEICDPIVQTKWDRQNLITV
jgi:hypothetical protein